jgi:hypothetical protein
MPARGASDKQGHDVEPSPLPSASRCGYVSIIIYNTRRARIQERKYGAASRPPSSPPLYLSVSLLYPRSFPWSIKGKARHPFGGSFFSMTQKHIPTLGGTSTPLHLYERLGSPSLCQPFVTPTVNSSASNTNSSPLDVGTFHPNYYTSSYPLCTPSKPKRAIHKFY